MTPRFGKVWWMVRDRSALDLPLRLRLLLYHEETGSHHRVMLRCTTDGDGLLKDVRP